VVIPFHDGIVFIGELHGAELGSWFSEIAQTLDAITGVSSGWGTEGRSSGGLLARSESGIARVCDKGGWPDLRSLGGSLSARVIFSILRYMDLIWSVNFPASL
jgi:hypothetical protein